MWHMVKIICISVGAFLLLLYLLLCWINMIDNDSETHKPAGEQ